LVDVRNPPIEWDLSCSFIKCELVTQALLVEGQVNRCQKPVVPRLAVLRFRTEYKVQNTGGNSLDRTATCEMCCRKEVSNEGRASSLRLNSHEAH